MALADKAITLIGGKGGVGKTTIAAALAVNSARQGKRCLLVSTDPAHSLGDVLGQPIKPRPTAVEAGLDAIEIDTGTLAADHVKGVSRALKDFAHPETWPDIDRQMAMARDAPGTREAALIEYLAGLLPLAGAEYDRLILDTAPTGHTLELLRMPETMGRWTERLLEQRQRHQNIRPEPDRDDQTDHRNQRIAERLQARQQNMQRARTLLTDAGRTGVVVVLTPEKLPILETGRLIRQLDDIGITVTGLVVNGRLPDSDESEFLRRRRERQNQHLDEIRRRFSHLPTSILEQTAEDPVGPDQLAALLEQRVPGRE